MVPSDTIARIKTDIEDKEGFPKKKQNLFFAGELLEDDKTLQDYCLREEKTLVLKFGTIMRIHIENESGQIIDLDVVSSDTIEDVKK